jgi:transcriptional regulator of acetoin/glycerol metabolism
MPGESVPLASLEHVENPTTEASAPKPISFEDAEKQAMITALKFYEGNITHASKFLGISRNTFYIKAKKYKLDVS